MLRLYDNQPKLFINKLNQCIIAKLSVLSDSSNFADTSQCLSSTT